MPHAGNQNFPSMLLQRANDHTEFLFYEKDPGVPVAVLERSVAACPISRAMPPE